MRKTIVLLLIIVESQICSLWAQDSPEWTLSLHIIAKPPAYLSEAPLSSQPWSPLQAPVADSPQVQLRGVLKELRTSYLSRGMDGNDREITGFQGWLEMQVGDFRAAELQFRDVLSSLVKADYESAEGRDQLADTLVAIGVAVERDGRDGAGFFKRALELRPSLVEESKRASTLEHLARALRTRGSSDENEAHLYETMAMRIRSRRVAHITTNEGSCQSCALDPKDEDVPMPKVLDITPPAYSYEAITSAVRGESRFCVDVRSSGEVSSVCLLRSAGFGLDENAAWAIARWRFEAQPSKGIVRIRYDLTD